MDNNSITSQWAGYILYQSLNFVATYKSCLNTNATMLSIYNLCEYAVVAQWPETMDLGNLRAIARLNEALLRAPFAGLLETVPAYTSLTIFFNPRHLPLEWDSPLDSICAYLGNLETIDIAFDADNRSEVHHIPVCYGLEFGPDLEALAALHSCTPAEVVAWHTTLEYTVFMMGFLPGFAYLGTVDDRIVTPRHAVPRLKVAAGSVGIAGAQTGIYPLDSPGGWQIIGRTPLPVYRPHAPDTPFLLKTGDTVRFYPISRQAFEQIVPGSATPAALPNDQALHLPYPPDAVVMRTGPYAALQDLGRRGYRAFGVPVSGAMDLPAHVQANALVGNAPEAATIECAMGGLLVRFCTEAVLAVTGGGVAFVNQKETTHGEAFTLQKDDVLEIKFKPNRGLRTYIAIRGGWDGIEMMGSKSVCTPAYLGQILQKNTHLRIGQAAKQAGETPPATAPDYDASPTIRVLHGPEFDRLDTEGQQALFQQHYTIDARSDRMGCRLKAAPLGLMDRRELLSTAVTPGTIQRTPDGQLIVLMNDCQTTGGYPRIGQVAAVDLPLLAQSVPGSTVRFAPISMEQARALFMDQQRHLYGTPDRH
jgi:antagonist of KipI